MISFYYFASQTKEFEYLTVKKVQNQNLLLKKMCEPTIRGEIKKARVGNYDVTSALFEFVDNAMDARADRIRIDIREKRGTGYPHKILISDNARSGIDRKTLSQMFSWTYERQRGDTEVGEYGTGFKTASVNLADKLTVITCIGENAYQAVADWQDMADENRWEPSIMQISNDYYSDLHPFSSGSTFILENLRYDIFCPLSITEKEDTMVTLLYRRLWDDIAYYYRYLLRQQLEWRITLKGVPWKNQEVCERDIREHDIFRKNIDPFVQDPESIFLTTTLSIYQDSLQVYRVYFQHFQTKKWYSVEFLEKRKNGNSILKCHEITPSMFTSMRLVDSLSFHSVLVENINRSTIFMNVYPTCTLDLLRQGRVMGRDLVLRTTPQPFLCFVKHELWYRAYALNSMLGIQYNKQNHGQLRENDLRYTLEYIQSLHEKEFHKKEKSRPRVAIEKVEEPTENILLLDEHTEPKILDLTQSIEKDMQPEQIRTSRVEQRRKNFPPSTKMQILHQQECRDPVFDFVLKEPILLTEYDHKNGRPEINSKENCQALSVLTHSIKTRFPDEFQIVESDDMKKTQYILDLLNCLTRSKYFLDEWLSGSIQILTPQQSMVAVQEGLFVFHHLTKKKMNPS